MLVKCGKITFNNLSEHKSDSIRQLPVAKSTLLDGIEMEYEINDKLNL